MDLDGSLTLDLYVFVANFGNCSTGSAGFVPTPPTNPFLSCVALASSLKGHGL